MGEFDTVLVVRDVRFYAHRAILSSVSPVFHSMFITENRDKYEVEHQVAAEDATSEEFEAFLHSIYPCGKEPTEEFLVPVAILADYYGVKPVLSACILLIVDHAGIPKVEKLRVAIKTNAAELE
ncbi:Protein BATH-38, partial [Aphelenchoides avenae]